MWRLQYQCRDFGVLINGCCGFGGYELWRIWSWGLWTIWYPWFWGIALWRLQFWRLRALAVTVLEFLILTRGGQSTGAAGFSPERHWPPTTTGTLGCMDTPRTFSRGGAEICINSGQKGAKNQPYASSLPCCRLPRYSHLAKGFRTHAARMKIM